MVDIARANALVVEPERCLAAGFDDYVSKPFTQRQIEALLRKWALGDEGAESPMGRRSRPADLPTDARAVLDEQSLQ